MKLHVTGTTKLAGDVFFWDSLLPIVQERRSKVPMPLKKMNARKRQQEPSDATKSNEFFFLFNDII